MMWRAVTARDAGLDGAFVYAVRSTGIYCRPSCPSRRPQRDKVVFFARPDAAERAGFRACLRCRPRQTSRGTNWNHIEHICRAIEACPEQPARLSTLAAETGLKPLRLQRLFRRSMGISPRGYSDAIRLQRLKTAMRRGNNVTSALYASGYGSSSRLYERSDSLLGMTPATYQRGGDGMEISYTIASCRLGRLLVAATQRGVSAIYLGDRDAQLEAALRDEYPKARIQRSPGSTSRWVAQIVHHLDGRQEQLDIPVDVQATAFQRRVWEALQCIRYGATASYAEIASSLGRPKAARAVARACATNPIAVLIPCHRVIRGDGTLGGYRWGMQRKKMLLAQEKEGRKK